MCNAEGDPVRMSDKRHLQSGFTLLELIITLAISAILIGLAMPSLQSLIGDSEMTSTTNEFVYSLPDPWACARVLHLKPMNRCVMVLTMLAAGSCSSMPMATARGRLRIR